MGRKLNVYLLGETLKVIIAFYLVSMAGEVIDLSWTCTVDVSSSSMVRTSNCGCKSNCDDPLKITL